MKKGLILNDACSCWGLYAPKNMSKIANCEFFAKTSPVEFIKNAKMANIEEPKNNVFAKFVSKKRDIPISNPNSKHSTKNTNIKNFFNSTTPLYIFTY